MSAKPRVALLWVALAIAACRPAPGAREVGPVLDLLASTAATALETRHYRFGIDGRAPLGSGWSGQREFDGHSHRHFVWATALESHFALEILRVEDKQGILAVRAAPGHPGDPPQRIEVRSNGRALSTIEPLDKFREYRLEIPAAALRIGENDLSFHHAVLRPTADRRDPRRFAAAYSTLILGPACLPLRPSGPPPAPRVEKIADAEGLRVTGPAVLRWRIQVPPAATLAAEIALARESEGAGEATLEMRDGESWVPLAEATLRLPWLLPRRPSTTLEGDLGAAAGREVDVRLLVRPPACETARTTVEVTRAMLTSTPSLPSASTD